MGKVIALLAEEGDDISNLEAPKEEAAAPLQSKEASSSDSDSSSPSPRKPESDRLQSANTHEPRSHSSTPLEHSRPLFPSVHRLLLEHNVTNLEQIKGTGVRGMLTKGDVLTFLGKASNPLGTFKFGPSPIEEASKLVEKKKDVVQVSPICKLKLLLNSISFSRSLSTERPYVDLSSIQCCKARSKPVILHQVCCLHLKYSSQLDSFFARPKISRFRFCYLGLSTSLIQIVT